jgi:radical SAM superfamily enzyme YgiQ (UPF0313 family)
MKVALLFPRIQYQCGQPPLGVLSLAAHLRRDTDAQVDVFDLTFQKKPFEYVRQVMSETNYDITGVSVMTSMAPEALEVSRLIKEINGDTFMIWGGPHATVLPDEVLSEASVDAVALGEGETTITKLVANGGNPAEVPGIWYKDRGGITVKNDPAPLASDLSALSWPARDSIDMESYIRKWYTISGWGPGLRGTSLIASRGCPFHCTYCQPTLNLLFGKKVRRRSTDDVLGELAHLKETYKLNAAFFEDDTFILNRPWVQEICDGIKESGFNLKWGCNARANSIDEDMIAKMAESGLVQLNIGIESATQRILDDVYDKGITVDDVRRAVQVGRRFGVKMCGYVMIGAPTETVQEINDTIRFVNKLPLDDISYSITTPLPGTRLWSKTKGMIKQSVSRVDYYHNSIYDSNQVVPSQKLEWLKRKAYLSFYFLSLERLRHTLKWLLTPTGIYKTVSRLKRF